jgi:hypothetical protein
VKADAFHHHTDLEYYCLALVITEAEVNLAYEMTQQELLLGKNFIDCVFALFFQSLLAIDKLLNRFDSPHIFFHQSLGFLTHYALTCCKCPNGMQLTSISIQERAYCEGFIFD